MKIKTVTITGADDQVPIFDLVELSAEFPFVEWGILFSGNPGRQRYPSRDWIDRIMERNDLQKSAHFCGSFSRAMLEKNDFHDADFFGSAFDRIQLNYNFTRSKDGDLFYVADWMKQAQVPTPVIIQYNRNNVDTIRQFERLHPDNSPFHYLHDASGGRGTVIEKIPEPHPLCYTGYAGGIDTNNVKPICEKILASPYEDEVWIDLESGARTDNEFDLDKVRRILSTVSNLITPKPNE